MSEKRHWLTRRLDGSYQTNIHSVAPHRRGRGWVTGDMKEWRHGEQNIKPCPDGTVYGHKLEPGGGPVDVSAWFPEGGKWCSNCGNSCDVTGKPCPHGGKLNQGSCNWKPREEEPEKKLCTGCAHESHPTICNGCGGSLWTAKQPGDIAVTEIPFNKERPCWVLDEYVRPSIPGAEARRRKMHKFPVEVWKVDKDGEREALLSSEIAPEFVVAKDKQAARDKVVEWLARKEANLDGLDIRVCNPLA